MRDDRALDVAEYFPGGGTDFEMPLDAALATPRRGALPARRRRADHGRRVPGVARSGSSASVARSSRLGFSLYSVLIDVGTEQHLARSPTLSDRVTSVSRLTDAAARDLFVSL